MPSVSDQLRDVFTARAFDLEKVKTASAKNIARILEDLMREIERELRDADPTGVTRTAYQQERLNKLFNMADKTIKSQYKGIGGILHSELATLAEIEGLFAAKAINAVLKVDVLDYVVSREVLEKLATDTLIEGAPSAEWWSKQAVSLQDEFKRVMRVGVAKGETLQQMSARVMGTQKPSLLGVRGRIPGVTDEVIEGLTYEPGLLKKARRNAEALVRTSYQTVMSEARRDAYRQNSDVIKGIQQISTLDSRTCWSPETLILMADGSSKPIGEVVEGDYVIGGLSGESCKVLATDKNIVVSSVEVCYNNKIIGRTTHEHKLLTPDGWKEAGEICLLSDVQQRQVLCRRFKAP